MRPEPADSIRKRYRFIAEEARRVALSEWLVERNRVVRLTDIDAIALLAAAQWRERKVSWNWAQLYRKWSRRPRHFGLAIWTGGTLCGLGIGRVTDGRAYARMDRLERNPVIDGSSKVCVTELAILFLEAVGRIADCREAVLWMPAVQLIPYYKSFGYETEILKRGKIVGLKRALT